MHFIFIMSRYMECAELRTYGRHPFHQKLQTERPPEAQMAGAMIWKWENYTVCVEFTHNTETNSSLLAVQNLTAVVIRTLAQRL